MTELIGHNLGRYHILGQLGEGGMASVYEAMDTVLQRRFFVTTFDRLWNREYVSSDVLGFRCAGSQLAGDS